MLHPAEFHFSEMPASPLAEAAARRRLRTLESAYPAVMAWQVRVTRPVVSLLGVSRYEAEVVAGVAGGDRTHATGAGVDVLGALRVAFNALENELEEERESARVRAAQWLRAVRSHLRQRQDSA